MGFMDFFNPPAAGVPLPSPIGVAGIPQAQSNINATLGNLGQYNTYGQILPQAGGIAQGMVNDPNAAGAQANANAASQFGMGTALGNWQNAQSLYPYAGAVMNTAFDPQQALYDRTAQQVAEQARAGQAARGVAMTPYGAGLENQNMRNFNIDWQNAQLQRQIGGLGAGAGAINTAANIQSNAVPLFMQAGQFPYQTSQGIGSNQLNALNQFGQFGQNAAKIPQAQVQGWQNYLGYGNQAQAANNQTAQLGLQQADQGFKQQMAMFDAAGRVVGAGMPFAGGMGGNFSPSFGGQGPSLGSYGMTGTNWLR